MDVAICPLKAGSLLLPSLKLSEIDGTLCGFSFANMGTMINGVQSDQAITQIFSE